MLIANKFSFNFIVFIRCLYTCKWWRTPTIGCDYKQYVTTSLFSQCSVMFMYRSTNNYLTLCNGREADTQYALCHHIICAFLLSEVIFEEWGKYFGFYKLHIYNTMYAFNLTQVHNCKLAVSHQCYLQQLMMSTWWHHTPNRLSLPTPAMSPTKIQ